MPLAILVLAPYLIESSNSMAADYYAKGIVAIETPSQAHNCLYFMLRDVTQADPVVPNNPWFAVPATQNGYKEMYAMLLTAWVTGKSVSARTTGTVAGGECGNYSLTSETYIYEP